MAVVRVVIVTYNSSEVIGRCLSSLREDVISGLAEVVVVDNGSTDDTLNIVDSFDWVHLLQSEANVGFGAGNNKGAAGSGNDYLLFLNPDTIVKSDAIKLMVSFLAENNGVGVVGPAIEDESGNVTLSTFRYVTPFHSIWIATGLQRIIPLNRTDGRTEIRTSAPNRICKVDRLLGAVMAMPRSSFLSVGGFDENFFLYSEEEDLCKRIQDRGEAVIYFPDARVRHIGGHSALPESPLAIASSVWSRQHFIQKHYGSFGEAVSRIVWAAALCTKLLFVSAMPRYKDLRISYRLALRSLISPGFYSKDVRPKCVGFLDLK